MSQLEQRITLIITICSMALLDRLLEKQTSRLQLLKLIMVTEESAILRVLQNFIIKDRLSGDIRVGKIY